MYVSNRKRSFKVIRKYKTKPLVKLQSCYGTEIVISVDKLIANGYKEVKSKPITFNRS